MFGRDDRSVASVLLAETSTITTVTASHILIPESTLAPVFRGTGASPIRSGTWFRYSIALEEAPCLTTLDDLFCNTR